MKTNIKTILIAATIVFSLLFAIFLYLKLDNKSTKTEKVEISTARIESGLKISITKIRN